MGEAHYNPVIQDSFYVGELVYINSSNGFMGGIVGRQFESARVATFSNTYWMKTNSGSVDCLGGNPSYSCSPSESIEIFDNQYFFDTLSNPLRLWDFDFIWKSSVSDYPTLVHRD